MNAKPGRGAGSPSPAGPLRDPSLVAYDVSGLVPVAVQDRQDGRVLMVAWSDAEALAATLASGEVHFHSRSRRRLWRKGETSGRVLRLVGLALDCDGDALLATVEPAGPTCHRGERSCFDADGSTAPEVDAGTRGPAGSEGFAWLESLWATIEDRAATRPPGSYTAQLLAAGVDGPGRKVVEEAVEVLMAAKDDDAAERCGADRGTTREAVAGEAADLLYHALVLLAERGLRPALVLQRLRARHAR